MVFIDETWAKTNMTRTHGWGERGRPLLDKVPDGHWKTLTFIAALRHNGIVAPCVIDGPINGESFAAWVEQFLIPELKPGSIVVIDNLGSHKGSRVRKLLRAAGIKLFFLPPYSPDLNPIEQVFSKLKRLLRKANERTVEATWRRLGSLLSTTSLHTNAKTTSATPAMRKLKSVLILASAALGMAVAVLSCCLCWLDLVSSFKACTSAAPPAPCNLETGMRADQPANWLLSLKADFSYKWQI